jgi:Ca2+-binding RTX toxin-like protein
LSGGAGDDTIDGNQGTDSVDGGADADTIVWDPGDGSDVVVGGAGIDHLAFNGANIGEIFDVSAVGDHVRFARNIGAVVIDLNDVESIDLRTLGGADIVNVSTVSATDLLDVNVDLAASLGGDDLAADTINVPSGLTISQDGAAATVTGFGANLRVVNGFDTDQIHVLGSGTDMVHIAGTAGPDAVTAVADASDALITGSTPGLPVRLTGIATTDVNLAGGDDQFSAIGDLNSVTRLVVDGGQGADVLRGGNGPDVLAGGPGNDVVDGNQGADVLDGGDDADTIVWDPGDGSDTVIGGAGADRLAFNGANIGETFDVSATGSHVRFSRNIGTVVLDIDQVEALDLRALGGADLLTVNDLTGTGLAEVNTDLGSSVGGTDAIADTVVVNGSAGDDTIDVSDEGSAVVVRGLAAAIRISNADATLDVLSVNGLDGVDSITATAGAQALISVQLVP